MPRESKYCKELKSLERIENYQVVVDIEKDKTATIKELLPSSCGIIENALKRIPELEKEIADTHEAYTMAIEKHIKDENEYIQWVQEGGYDKKEVEAFQVIKEELKIDLFYDDKNNEYWIKTPHYVRTISKDKYDILKKVLL